MIENSTPQRSRRHEPHRPPRRERGGAGLLVTLAVVSLITVMVVSVYDLQLARWAAVRNTSDYERALYLAGAAVHHAMAELEQDADWRDGVLVTEFPAGSGQTYTATVVDTAGGMVVVTGTGTAGDVSRKLQVTIDPGD